MLDLDDTLTDSEKAFGSWLAGWLQRFPADQRRSVAGYLTGPELVGLPITPRFAAVRERFSLPESTEELVGEFTTQAPTHCRFVAGAVDGLATLRRSGTPLAVVTNGPSALQRAKVTHLGLDRLVDAVVISGEVGVAKPDREIFALAARQLGRPLIDGWMIGDNPVTDIGGARDCGLRTVWLRHGRTWKSEDGANDLSAEDLTEALDLVAAHQATTA